MTVTAVSAGTPLGAGGRGPIDLNGVLTLIKSHFYDISTWRKPTPGRTPQRVCPQFNEKQQKKALLHESESYKTNTGSRAKIRQFRLHLVEPDILLLAVS